RYWLCSWATPWSTGPMAADFAARSLLWPQASREHQDVIEVTEGEPAGEDADELAPLPPVDIPVDGDIQRILRGEWPCPKVGDQPAPDLLIRRRVAPAGEQAFVIAAQHHRKRMVLAEAYDLALSRAASWFATRPPAAENRQGRLACR